LRDWVSGSWAFAHYWNSVCRTGCMHPVVWSLAGGSLFFVRPLASCLDLRNYISSADWVCRFDIPTIVLWVTCIVCAGRLPYDTIQEYQIRNSLASLLRRLLETIFLSESGQCVYICRESHFPVPGPWIPSPVCTTMWPTFVRKLAARTRPYRP
jgi:hypothetical protein